VFTTTGPQQVPIPNSNREYMMVFAEESTFLLWILTETDSSMSDLGSPLYDTGLLSLLCLVPYPTDDAADVTLRLSGGPQCHRDDRVGIRMTLWNSSWQSMIPGSARVPDNTSDQ